MIDQIIEYNKTFVAQKGYEKYLTDKYPDKKLAVLSCMDCGSCSREIVETVEKHSELFYIRANRCGNQSYLNLFALADG